MKKVALPLVLLASIATLTSCSNKSAEMPTVETPAPQAVVETPVAPATPAPDAMTPPTVPTDASGTTAPAPATESTGTTAAPTSAAPITKAGTVSYTTPAGNDSVQFSITVTDGVITDASATPMAANEISNKLQTAFAGDIKSKVVGKKISELSLSAVGGASLTTGAFNKFVQSF